MLVTYTNTSSIPQAIYDVYGTPRMVQPGQSVTYLDKNSLPSSFDGLIMKIETDVSGNILYMGYAHPGTGASQLGWAIKKPVIVGNEESWLWAGDGLVLRYKWSLRASYSYS